MQQWEHFLKDMKIHNNINHSVLQNSETHLVKEPDFSLFCSHEIMKDHFLPYYFYLDKKKNKVKEGNI